jgi:hypothetical protein
VSSIPQQLMHSSGFEGVEGDEDLGDGLGVRNVLEAAIVCHANRALSLRKKRPYGSNEKFFRPQTNL